MFELIDSHAHLYFPKLYARLQEILTSAKEKGVHQIVSISADRDKIAENLSLVKEYSSDSLPIFATLGVHPDHFNDPEASTWEEEVSTIEQELRTYYAASTLYIKAMGETGLDYYRTFHRDAQRALFLLHITLAAEWDLPLVIHIRDAFDDFFTLLEEFPQLRGVVHCFTGTPKQAEKILSYPNMLLSYTGIASFSNAKEVQDSVRITPVDRMMIETDSPFLAPVPFRGKVNEPAYVLHVAEAIASLKELSLEAVAEHTTKNAKAFFGI